MNPSRGIDTGRKRSSLFGRLSQALLVGACAILCSTVRGQTNLADELQLTGLQAGAEKGDAQAQSRLADAYSGRLDSTNALVWYRKAAEQGEPHAQWQLGRHYEFGAGGVSTDRETALKWYLKAATQGYANAQCDLGQVWERGSLGTQDYTEAYKWYTLASSNRSILARANRDRLALKMTPQQIQEGQERAKQFAPVQPEPQPIEGAIANQKPEKLAECPPAPSAQSADAAQVVCRLAPGPGTAHLPDRPSPPPAKSADAAQVVCRLAPGPATAHLPDRPAPSPAQPSDAAQLLARLALVTASGTAHPTETCPVASFEAADAALLLARLALVTATASTHPPESCPAPSSASVGPAQVSSKPELAAPTVQLPDSPPVLSLAFGRPADVLPKPELPTPTPCLSERPPAPSPISVGPAVVSAKPGLAVPIVHVPDSPPTASLTSSGPAKLPAKPDLATPITHRQESPLRPSLTSTGAKQMQGRRALAAPTVHLPDNPAPPSRKSAGAAQPQPKPELVTAPESALMVNSSLASKLQLKGISAFKNFRVATINGRSLSKGEDMEVNVDGATVKVRCLEIKASSAVFEVEGMAEKIELKLAH